MERATLPATLPLRRDVLHCIPLTSARTPSPLRRLIGGKDSRLIYRHYATLFFVMAVDSSESELGILDLIQVFVESLDRHFGNVCELDIVFHYDKVQAGLPPPVLLLAISSTLSHLGRCHCLRVSILLLLSSPRCCHCHPWSSDGALHPRSTTSSMR